jgi:glycosyltransferase involved in cell wall biosynthesis
MNGNKTYTAKDLVFIIPTKDRPEKIKDLFNSFKEQTVKCSRIIVINGGESIEEVVSSFSDSLPIEYHECYPPGQIRQRNMAISMLNKTTSLVGVLDDDIVLLPKAIENMVDFWNKTLSNTAGVSFNIVNVPPYKHSLLGGLMIMSAAKQGVVLSSGINTSIESVPETIRSEWLCGGATVWKQEIVQKFMLKEINTRWAACEDVLFSYPIGKKFPLYVCADAKVRHEHVLDHKVGMKYRFYGKTQTLWRLYFVELNKDLSRLSYFWNLFTMIIARFSIGLLTLNKKHMQFGIGQIEGGFIGLLTIMGYRNLLLYLE